MDRLLRLGASGGLPNLQQMAGPPGDTPTADTAETVYISSLAPLKILKISTEQDSSLAESEESESIPLPIVEDISEPNESSTEEPQMEAFLERPIPIHIDRDGLIAEGIGEPMQLSDEVIFEENLADCFAMGVGEEVEIIAGNSTASGENDVSEADDIYAGLIPLVGGPMKMNRRG